MMRAYIPIHDRHGTPGLSETRTRLHIRYGIEFSHERGGRGHVIRPRTRSTAEPRTPSTTTRGQATQMTAKITTCEARVPPKRPANTRTHTHTWCAGELQPGKGGRTGPKVRGGSKIRRTYYKEIPTQIILVARSFNSSIEPT